MNGESKENLIRQLINIFVRVIKKSIIKQYKAGNMFKITARQAKQSSIFNIIAKCSCFISSYQYLH